MSREFNHRSRLTFDTGAKKGDPDRRHPGAPAQPADPEAHRADRPVCPSCGWPSTVSYRCSECGHDLTGDSS